MGPYSNRSPKFDQNMQPVVLNGKQVSNICYNHSGGNHSKTTDVNLNLPPK